MKAKTKLIAILHSFTLALFLLAGKALAENEPASETANTPSQISSEQNSEITASIETETQASPPVLSESDNLNAIIGLEELPATASGCSETYAVEWKGKLNSALAFDVLWQNDYEDVVDWQNRAALSLLYSPDRSSKAFLEGNFLHRALTNREMDDCVFGVTEGAGCRNHYELLLGEAYYDRYFSWFDLRIGNQIVNWSSLDGESPLDIVNPRDYRYPLFDLDAKLPVFSARGSVYLSDFTATLFWQPFFAANRYYLFGDDFALYQPGMDTPLPFTAQEIKQYIDPSEIDPFQQIQATDYPDESLDNSTVALRLQYSIWDFDLQAMYYYGFEKSPRIELDDSMRDAMRILKESRAASGGGMSPAGVNQLNENQNQLVAAARKIYQNFLLGTDSVHAYFPRSQTMGLGIFRIEGDFTFKTEAAFTPKRTFYSIDFNPISASAIDAGEEITYEYGDPLIVTAGAYETWLPKIPQESLIFYEDRGIDASVFLHVISKWLRTDLELEGMVRYGIYQEDIVAISSALYKITDSHHAKIGAMFFTGPKLSEKITTGGAMEKNDLIFVEYEYVF